MRNINKDQIMKSPQDNSAAGMSANIPQQQPLQARSSNSGTSVKKSDISQSSYYGADVSSDKAFHWQKSTSPISQAAPGHLTNAFAQKRDTNGNAQTITIKNPTSNPAPKRTSRDRTPNPEEGSSTIANAQTIVNLDSIKAGVSTRGQGRSSRTAIAGQRAVKDLSQNQCKNSFTNSNENDSLKPVKQTNSEPANNMRTTRSKAKSKQHDNTLPSHPQSHEHSMVSNGQSEPFTDGNLEKVANISINLKPVHNFNTELSHHWQGEESKHQSPRSLLSTQNGAVLEKLGNQSFQINDSTDSLLENPLTAVIKQFQNLRVNAQLTGKNKPTIQQFLEKFEKEMQYLEEQYQAQQQAREEQMRLFEQAYGANGQRDLASKQTKPQPQHPSMLPNDYLGALSYPVCQNASSQIGNDILMAQDTSTLGPMPHENSNLSFISGIHGPNVNGGSLFGDASGIISNEVYESFVFSQNSLLNFYPREVRKILTRRKSNNSANSIAADLKNMKQPKHQNKVKKSLSKMHSLGLCQMNFMQILLQKISRKSKVIRKQEKIVNDNLKRKRIYLEREQFDLMSVLRRSLEPDNMSQGTLKNVKHQKTRMSGSDMTSQYKSTVTMETKYGNDQLLTSSVNHIGTEVTSLDGNQKRHDNRKISGQENCLSLTDSGSQQIFMSRHQAASDRKALQTPEPTSNKVHNKQQQFHRAEEQVKQALNLSEIEDSFPNVQKSSSQLVSHVNSSNASRMGQSTHKAAFYSTLEAEFIEEITPKKTPDQEMIEVHRQSETPMFDYAQHKITLETQTLPPSTSEVTQKSSQASNMRKMKSTQSRVGKRKSATIAIQQPPPALNLFMSGDAAGSFAIADLSADLQAQALPSGKVSLSLKMQESKVSNSSQSGAWNDQLKSITTKKTRKAQQQVSGDQGIQMEQKPKSQRKLSPLQHQAQEINRETMVNTQQHSAYIRSHTMPEVHYVGAHLPVDEPYYGLNLMNDNMDLQHDHFLMDADHHHQQGIFNEYIKHANHVPQISPDLQQPLIAQNDVSELAMNRSQSVMLPQSNFLVRSARSLLDPIVSQNLAGSLIHGFVDPILQHQNQIQFEQERNVLQQSRVIGITHRQGDIMDPFFDESPAELSSIEHTDYNVRQPNQNQSNLQAEAFGYQSGANPYEQAKRRYMESQKKLESHNSAQVNTHPVGNNGRDKDDQRMRHEMNYEAVHNFVSPMDDLRHMSARQTPQTKMMAESQQVHLMVDGTSTPSHFMSGVEEAATGLGRGSIAQHSLALQQRLRLAQQAQQLSVNRLCGDGINQSAFSNPFNMSAGDFHQDRHQDSAHGTGVHQGHHLSYLGVNCGNTPADLCSATQTMADTHRQHLSVSGWNLDGANQGNHNMVSEPVHHTLGSGEQLYQALPNPYM